MTLGCIFNIQRYSLHDGGGIRTIVFMKGCPFHCPWCSNPESINPKPEILFLKSLCMNCSKKVNGICNTSVEDCPTGAKELIGTYHSVDELFDIIQRDQVFYETSNGGVTISGGECLMQQTFTIDLLAKCKQAGIHTAIETTLGLPISNVNKLVQVTDLFLVDFKIMEHKQAKNIIGINIDIFEKNIEDLLQKGAHIIPRIPLIPEFTNNRENLNLLTNYLMKKGFHEVHLLPFHKLGESKYEGLQMNYTLYDIPTLRDDEVDLVESQFKKSGFKVIVGGN